MRKRLLVIIVAASAVLCGYALVRAQVHGTAHSVGSIKSVSHTWTGTGTPALSDIEALNHAVAMNQAIPSNWQASPRVETVKATDSGFDVPGTGERAWSVTVYVPTDDISSATVFVNNQPQFTATRANGAIVDRAGMSLATLPVLVPPAGQSWTGKVQWIANNGTVRYRNYSE